MGCQVRGHPIKKLWFWCISKVVPLVCITQIRTASHCKLGRQSSRKMGRAGKGSKAKIAQTIVHFECVCGFLSVSLKCAFRSTRFFCGTDTFLILLSAVRCNYFVCPSAQRSLGAPGWNSSSCTGTSCTFTHCYLRPRIYLNGEATQNPNFLCIKHRK